MQDSYLFMKFLTFAIFYTVTVIIYLFSRICIYIKFADLIKYTCVQNGHVIMLKIVFYVMFNMKYAIHLTELIA